MSDRTGFWCRYFAGGVLAMAALWLASHEAVAEVRERAQVPCVVSVPAAAVVQCASGPFGIRR